MSIVVTAGPPGEPQHRRAARAALDILADELPRVRAGALAWRNGLGALLAGLLGFSLVKGRSDVSQLTPPAAVLVGVLLLAALLAGVGAALLIMRAAHGRPYAVAVRTVLDGSAENPAMVGRLAEADASSRALFRGVALSLGCLLLLTGAVALTWYGPAKGAPQVEVRLVNGAVHCGEVVSLAEGRLTLRTSRGTVGVDLTQADGMAAVAACR